MQRFNILAKTLRHYALDLRSTQLDIEIYLQEGIQSTAEYMI